MDYQVAVIICTYNPEWEKLKSTIDSCLSQKGINFQVVISDDGSKENFFLQVKEYFSIRNYDDYILLPSAENQGTVLNFYKGITATTASYIKFLSPGDFFCDENVLKNWLDRLIFSGKMWSFGNAVYLQVNSVEQKIVSVKTHPQLVEPYLKDNEEKCRWNYVVLKDIALGAAILSERDITLQYLERIMDKIKYAEDNIYRLMMFDGIVSYYHNFNVIFYEYGTGISTGKSSKWQKILEEEWYTADTIMLNEQCNTKIQKKMSNHLGKERKGIFYKVCSFFLTRGKIRFLLHCKLFPTMTEVEVLDNAGD